MIVENNVIRNSGHYGLDPHTGTHDMIIRNNTVFDNKGGSGIICSLDCYNILIENNKVHDNAATEWILVEICIILLQGIILSIMNLQVSLFHNHITIRYIITQYQRVETGLT